MKTLGVIASAILLISSFVVNSAQFANCSGCSSSVSYSTAAENLALTTTYSKTLVYSFNMAAGQIKAYDVYVEREPGGAVYTTAIEKAVDSNTKSKFNDLSQKYNSVVQHARQNEIIPSSIASSAYQLVGASHRVNSVIDFYNNNQSFRTKTANYVAAAIALTGKLVDIQLTITVYFSNQSQATFRLSGVGPNGELKLNLKSAKDVDNNDIPLTKAGYETGGEYNFSQGGQNAIEQFIQAAARTGVMINSGSGGGFTQTMSCDSEGNCTITVKPV